MKYSIDNIKNTYDDATFIGLCECCDPEPFNVFVVDDDDKIIAIYESVWSDDFESTEYEFTREYAYIGRKMADVAEEIFDGGLYFCAL